MYEPHATLCVIFPRVNVLENVETKEDSAQNNEGSAQTKEGSAKTKEGFCLNQGGFCSDHEFRFPLLRRGLFIYQFLIPM